MAVTALAEPQKRKIVETAAIWRVQTMQTRSTATSRFMSAAHEISVNLPHFCTDLNVGARKNTSARLMTHLFFSSEN